MSRFAGVLSQCGVGVGDRVVIYMPMIPQTIVAMLACARLGAIHSLVFGGFAPKELATRIEHAKPRVIVTANAGVEPGRIVDYRQLLDEALDLSAHKPHKCVYYNRPNVHKEVNKTNTKYPHMFLDYKEEMAKAKAHDCVPLDSNAPLYTMYTSGWHTTL